MQLDQKEILKNIRKLAPRHCDNCGNKYIPNDFKVLKLIESSALMHLRCTKCGNTYVINAFASGTGIGSQRMPLVLDLNTAEEIERFATKGSISADDAIDMYNALKENQDLEILLQQTLS